MPRQLQARTVDRRRFLTGTATAVGGAALASRGMTGSAVAAGRAQDKTKVTFWFFSEWVAQAVTAFNEKNPTIEVEFQQLSYPDVHNKLLTSLAAGSGAPDVVGIELGYVGTFASSGGLSDLNQAPFNAGSLVADLVDYKVQQGSTADGKLVLMPWDIAPGGIIYRADLLEQNGFDPDPAALQEKIKSWDDWFAFGEEVKAKNGDLALMADAFSDIFGTQVEQQGHGWFDGTKVVVEEKGTKPLQAAADVRQRGLDLKVDEGSPDWAASIRNDEYFGDAAACWAEGGLKREQPQTVGKWRAIRAPGPGFNIGGSFLAIPEQSENQEAAWEFIKFLAGSTEGALLGLREGGAFPSYKPSWKDKVFDEPVEFYGGQPTYRLWLDVAQGIPGAPIQPGEREASDIVNAEVTLVKQEDKDPTQAMKDAEAQVLKKIKGTTA